MCITSFGDDLNYLVTQTLKSDFYVYLSLLNEVRINVDLVF